MWFAICTYVNISFKVMHSHTCKLDTISDGKELNELLLIIMRTCFNAL